MASLQALVKRRETLRQMHQMEGNRLEGAAGAVRDSVEAVLSLLSEQVATTEHLIRQHIDQNPGLKARAQSDLLETIPGIGKTTAAVLLAELGEVGRFD